MATGTRTGTDAEVAVVGVGTMGSMTDRLLAPVRAAVAALLRGLIPDPVRIGAYQDGYTADHHAAVGRAPGLPNTLRAAVGRPGPPDGGRRTLRTSPLKSPGRT